MSRLRFLTFNIHGGRSRDGLRDLARVNTLMDRLDIDIGVFQEMDTRPSHGGTTSDVDILAGPNRPYRFEGPSKREGEGWYGNLLVSRFPLIQTAFHNLETIRFFEPRNAIDALIQSPLGTIRVVGTHLSLSPFMRWSEAQNLLQLMTALEEKERSPLFLLGDINEWHSSKLLRFLDRVMIPVPCKGTFPSWLPVLKLDRVWHDAPGMCVSARRLKGRGINILSDHLPVLLEAERN
jgi:endonuclease/exonuclease/phosphatase family metal-dependent hydrolase